MHCAGVKFSKQTLKGCDFGESIAFLARGGTLNAISSLKTHQNHETYMLDVKAAFPWSNVEKLIY